MKTTHVFIVDTNTFKYHLEYLFAGTGAKDTVVDFNKSPNTSLKYASENNLLGMVADSQRVRKGDYVIFYLQQNASEGVYEGKFYGIFKAKEDLSFLDHNDSHQFLKDELQKSLTFRTFIEPFEVYPKGVTEWEALDEIKYIQSPNQMLWSLIYRKLKGNRGNTMITIYESERLRKLIQDKNRKQALDGTRFTLDFDVKEIKLDATSHDYAGRQEKIDVLPRLISKHDQYKAFESHLQAYVVQNVGRNTNASLDGNILLEGFELEWLGNEVSCGVGMQRIDVMFSLVKGDKRTVVPVELKAVEASEINTIQIQRYVDWLEQYYIPNRISDIQPVLIAKKTVDKTSAIYQRIIKTFNEFNEKNTRCNPLRYVEYEVADGKLKFYEVKYRK
jgi:predicted RNA-binding protein